MYTIILCAHTRNVSIIIISSNPVCGSVCHRSASATRSYSTYLRRRTRFTFYGTTFFFLFFLDYEITNKNSALECLSTMMNYHIMSRNNIGLFLASETRTISRYNACRCEYKCTTSHTRREFSIIRKSMKDIFAYVHQITALIKKSFK